MKVVINTTWGGFSISTEGEDELLRRGAHTADPWDISRTDPILVQMIEEDADRYGNGSLAVVEVPDDVQWHIHNYDGREHVAENHRIWR